MCMFICSFNNNIVVGNEGCSAAIMALDAYPPPSTTISAYPTPEESIRAHFYDSIPSMANAKYR